MKSFEVFLKEAEAKPRSINISIEALIGFIFVLVGIYLSQKYASVKNN